MHLLWGHTMNVIQKKYPTKRLLLGRHEWCSLPDLHIPAIKAKIDTGAKTSALHAFHIRVVKKNQKRFVRFDIHPLQNDEKILVSCIAPLIDERHITSSSGHIECRYVIMTTLVMGDQEWGVEVTLSNRDPMRYRMLLGREALSSRVLIDPSLTCQQKKITRKTALKLYH
ncbi:MAG: Ribosomal protein S6 modification protein (RimK) [uncultured bacterium]|nr:MAG: Ribosomal protein S6 modification protein (RimK) [uncultured bacterium]